MVNLEQRQELHNKIWRVANDLRGSIDGWDFKQYILGTLFYRFLSENFVDYMNGGDPTITYAKMDDSDIPDDIIQDTVKTKGYFIYPSQLFSNIYDKIEQTPNLSVTLGSIFNAIEDSSTGYPSEERVKGLFNDLDLNSYRLGSTIDERNGKIKSIIKGIGGLNFGRFEESDIDVFGDAYEYLMLSYASNAGKKGGEYFTPQKVANLVARIATHNLDSVDTIYDPTAGSGSLLIEASKHLRGGNTNIKVFGQEINPLSNNLARMNMLLHNINYTNFNIALGDTLSKPHFKDEKPFDVIVSNPPYSIKWEGDSNPKLIDDDRFAPAGVLAPKSKADFAFILHSLNYLSDKGRAVIVCFPGVFYRGGAEQKIRKYLVDNNYVEAVIALPCNLFFGTPTAVTILVLSKHKTTHRIKFIDASGEDFFRKASNNNIIEDGHIDKIMKIFEDKEDITHVAVTLANSIIAENDYNLSVSSYVEARDSSEVIDITTLNLEITETVSKINTLRDDIDNLIKNLEV